MPKLTKKRQRKRKSRRVRKSKMRGGGTASTVKTGTLINEQLKEEGINVEGDAKNALKNIGINPQEAANVTRGTFGSLYNGLKSLSSSSGLFGS
jgi:hypothetical protein